MSQNMDSVLLVGVSLDRHLISGNKCGKIVDFYTSYALFKEKYSSRMMGERQSNF